ncbi:tripartite tricarboxylate transporter substrate binding protein [Bacillus sp. JJ1521]|uniref:Bug family tripartite tricarboxylate transporter substrate binding protein n=1 Tax=Bacillus sp. JJ1521 TaxID=3122957 RepID=UPI002FFDDC20
MKKLVLLLSTLILLLIFAGCSQSSATGNQKTNQSKSDYPSKPIELIVPYGTGTGPDLSARIYADVVTKYLPNQQPIVVINRPGGSGTVGATEVFQAKPDGYKIGQISPAVIGILPHLGDTPFTHDSFQALMKIAVSPAFFVVKADAPWQTYEEWLEYTKENPDKFTYGISVLPQQMPMEAISLTNNIKIKPTMFKSGPEVLNALLGGHVHGAVIDITTVLPQLESRKLRVLLNVGQTKVQDFPMIQDKGVDFNFEGGNILWTPKGVPEDVVEILHDAFKKAHDEPEVQEKLKKLNIITTYEGPEETQKEITELYYNSEELLKAVGLIK